MEAHGAVFATEYLPGQFDQRADSAAQCIQIISQGERPLVRTAKVYVLEGALTEEEVEAVKKYVINPVEAREAALAKPETLRVEYPIPETVKTLEGFFGPGPGGPGGSCEDSGAGHGSGRHCLLPDLFPPRGPLPPPSRKFA